MKTKAQRQAEALMRRANNVIYWTERAKNFRMIDSEGAAVFCDRLAEKAQQETDTLRKKLGGTK